MSAPEDQEKVALFAINQITAALNSIAESQIELCRILNEMMTTLSKPKVYNHEESNEKDY